MRGAESYRPEERLTRSGDYRRAYRQGRRRHGSLWILHWTSNGRSHPRLGITVSRKVGGAVVRIRTKRRIREIYRRWSERRRLPPIDLVVHVKPAAAKASFEEMERELQGQLKSLLPEGS
jgi:ribonuclease P protein component